MKKFDLFRIWLHEYFKHPLENIRQADPIVPRRLYTAFGNVVKAVPYSKDEDREHKCDYCAFQQHGIPCPYHNKLFSGEAVCDKYKYIIIKKA